MARPSMSSLRLPQLSSCGPIEALTGRRLERAVKSFRNCQVAAPLKPGRPARRGPSHAAFRNCQVAAPLKHCPVCFETAISRTFRNCQVAAPLKQRSQLCRRRRGGLPQLSSCGPIEAQILQALPGALPPAFRNCQVAAPLKPSSAEKPRACRRALPQLSSCGPIEAGRRRRVWPCAGCLPQLSSCGPIEASWPTKPVRRHG